jgi:hypothetical protein
VEFIFVGLWVENKFRGRAVRTGGMVVMLALGSAGSFYFHMEYGDPHHQEQVACGCRAVTGWCHTEEDCLERPQSAGPI